MDESVKDSKNYIDDDVQGRPFLWFTVGFVIFTVASFLFVYWSYGALSDYHTRNQAEAPTRVQTGDVVPPAPHLQSDPVADMVIMDAAQNALLDSYGWIDKEQGVVRIPVDRAAELILARLPEESVTESEPTAEPEAASEPEEPVVEDVAAEAVH